MSKETLENKVPAVGQRWRDNDKRFADEKRELVIYQISTCSNEPRFWCAVYKNGIPTGRKVHVLASRFKPIATGYVYVGEGAPK